MVLHVKNNCATGGNKQDSTGGDKQGPTGGNKLVFLITLVNYTGDRLYEGNYIFKSEKT